MIAAGVAMTGSRCRLLARNLFLAEDGVDYVPGQRGYRMLAAINRSHSNLVNHRRMKSQGDPFVITLAQARGGVVVTEEGRGSPAKPGIPLVCDDLSVPVINLLTLIDNENWTYD